MNSAIETSGRKNKRAPQPSSALAVRDASLVTRAAVAVALFGAAVLVFSPVLNNQFVDWDDYDTLIGNTHFRGLGWTELRWMFTTFHMGHYQPLSWISFAIDYALWGLNPFGYHLTNILLHAGNAALVFFVARGLLGAPSAPTERLEVPALDWAAAFAALLFALHPLRVESVAWATERRDVLSGFFFLWTIYAYLRAASSARAQSYRNWLTAALIFYLLSLLSKATAISAPGLLIVLDLFPLRRLPPNPLQWLERPFLNVLIEKSPFLGFATAFGAAAAFAQRSSGALKQLGDYGLLSRFEQAGYGLAFYLWKLFVPMNLSPIYELPYDPRAWLPVFLASAIGAILLTVCAWVLRRKWPALLACWAAYAILLAPVLGFAQSGPQLVAERYTYLPSISWALLVAGSLVSLAVSGGREARHRKIGAYGVCGAIVIVLAVLTGRQATVWRDTRTLWEHAIAVTPDSSVAHYNLGKVHETGGQFEDALVLYGRAVALNPANPDAHHNLARLLGRQHRYDEAISHYRAALAVRPDDPDTLNNLGLLLAVRGDTEHALLTLKKAVQVDPRYSRAYFNMAKIFARRDDTARATENYQQAIRLNPNEPEIRLGFGTLLAREGQLAAAAKEFQLAVALNPELADAHTALARALAAQGKSAEAEGEYREALRLLQNQQRSTPAAAATRK